MGLVAGLRNIGELSLSSVTVISMETMLVSLRGEVLVASATLKAYMHSITTKQSVYYTASKVNGKFCY